MKSYFGLGQVLVVDTAYPHLIKNMDKKSFAYERLETLSCDQKAERGTGNRRQFPPSLASGFGREFSLQISIELSASDRDQPLKCRN